MLLCDCARLVVVCMVVVRSGCLHQRIPRSVVALVFAPSVIISYATDLPRPPSPRSSSMIGASGEPWTTMTTACPCRASRTLTASRRLLCARHPCSSPLSLLSSSSSRNALPKVGGGGPPRNRARTPLLPRRCRCHPPSQRRCHCCLPSRPMNNAPMLITGIDVVVVAGLRRRRAAVPSLRRLSGGGSHPPGGGGIHPGGVGGQRHCIRRTPPPPLHPPPLTRYRSKS